MARKPLRAKNPVFHLMMLPGIILIIIYNYIPMAGIIMAFQDFKPAKGLFGQQKWIGLDNFKLILTQPNTFNVLRNTIFIAVMKIIVNLVVPIFIALLLNELRTEWLKRSIQTSIYFPYFVSWIILAGIFVDVLSPTTGVVNGIIKMMGYKPVYFLAEDKLFLFILIFTDVWKNYGFGTIIYLAAIANIPPELFESSIIDGANRLHQAKYITIPSISIIIIFTLVLSVGNVLNAGFEQVLAMQNPAVLKSGEIIDTYVYKAGLQNARYSYATAFGLMKSIVSLVLIALSYAILYKIDPDYRVL